jgi:hypothetical protein
VPDSPKFSGWDPAATALLELLPRTARGPRREGVFALWLTVRVAQDLLMDAPPPERAYRRRVAALEGRLSSLTVPPPLRRALTAAMTQLREARPDVAPIVLSQLVAPARDSAGPEAGDAVAQAARSARESAARNGAPDRARRSGAP